MTSPGSAAPRPGAESLLAAAVPVLRGRAPHTRRAPSELAASFPLPTACPRPAPGTERLVVIQPVDLWSVCVVSGQSHKPFLMRLDCHLPFLWYWALCFLGPRVLFPLGNSVVTGSRVVQHWIGSLWQSREALSDGRRFRPPSQGSQL